MTDRLIEGRAVAGEVKQFKKLQHLSDYDVAHRMAINLASVATYRAQFHQKNIPLSHIGISYEVRILLGKQGIGNSTELFALSDRALLALPGIGPARLAHIRKRLREFFS
jgi:hypothetical protein